MVLTNYVEPSLSKVCTVASKSPIGRELQNLACEQNDDSENTVPMSIIDGVDINLNARQNSILEHQENPRKNDLIETPRKRKLRQLISVQENFIKKQKLQIKRLQKKTSRYQKKITNLKEILKSLNEKNYISADHVTQLENIGVTDRPVVSMI
ncbi:unnamed protein product [Parnassius apollo]|uniref:(apollo) hypothetical protein n=1 Tax=Parnassius apollo TaxID=110799 RepID=A0A8S3XMQ9_PARAO|nr:unnamed protein product [Parnassius apollo]